MMIIRQNQSFDDDSNKLTHNYNILHVYHQGSKRSGAERAIERNFELKKTKTEHLL